MHTNAPGLRAHKFTHAQTHTQTETHTHTYTHTCQHKHTHMFLFIFVRVHHTVSPPQPHSQTFKNIL